jgi:hypothetical protein
LLALLSVAVAANAAPFCSASVDADGNIHVRSPAGVDQRITDDGHYDAPLLAANGAIVAWRRSFNAINIEDDHGELGALYLYDGTTRVLHCEPCCAISGLSATARKLASTAAGFTSPA